MKISITKSLVTAAFFGSLILTAQAVHAAPQNDLFNRFKQIESRSHLGRIAILQEAEICLQQAQNREQFRQCEQKEKAGREALRAELQPQREALRAKVQTMRERDIP